MINKVKGVGNNFFKKVKMMFKIETFKNFKKIFLSYDYIR